MVVAQYLLTFREVLEAALLSAIILAFLIKTGRNHLVKYAWYGILGAAVASLGLGAGVWLAYGTLSKASQVLFEGVAALIAVAVLTSMIYWMAVKGRTIKKEVEGRVERAVTQGAVVGLVSLTFILVFREGLETVLFLTPTFGIDPTGTLVGAALGVLAGTLLAYGVFKMGLKLDLRKFFYFTSLLLILIAGGLLGYGVHELIEYGEIQGSGFGLWGEAAFTLPIAADSVLHHKGAVGSIFAVMFGYTVSAEWGRVVAHVVYLAVALPLVIILYRRPEWVTSFLSRVRALLRFAPASPSQGP